MSVFKWIPEDSDEKVSPWLGLYVGLTLLLTLCINWVLKKSTRDVLETSRQKFYKELENEDDSTLFPRHDAQSFSGSSTTSFQGVISVA